MSTPVDLAALECMRTAMRSLMDGAGVIPSPAPIRLLEVGHLGPLAYKLGVKECRAEYAASTIVSLRRSAMLTEALAAFAQRGVRAALLKGIAYVDTLYADPAERPMNDVDLLVPPTELPEAIRSVQGLGFVRAGMARKLSGYYHAMVFQRDGLMLELHRNIVQPYRTKIRLGSMWKRARPDPRGTTAMRLDPVDELLLCMLHIARHELAVPAINYVDVWRSWRRLDDAQRATLHERALDMHISRATQAVQSMTDKLANGERGHPELGAASRLLPTTDEVLLGVRPPRLRQVGQKLSLLEGPRELAGLGFVYVKTYLDGLRRTRDH